MDSTTILGTGRYGFVVRGQYREIEVAVERTSSFKKETENLVRSFNHKNVAKLLHVERDDTDPALYKYRTGYYSLHVVKLVNLISIIFFQVIARLNCIK